MAVIRKRSPVSFAHPAVQTVLREGWEVVLEYASQGNGRNGPHLIDLSHKVKWDVQDKDLSRLNIAGVSIPEKPGQAATAEGMLIRRMNRTQAGVWHLGESAPEFPEESAFSDVTEAALLLALLGESIFSIMEKVSALDFGGQGQEAPFLLQGPVLHIPCQVVSLGKSGGKSGGIPAVLIACSRGYGHCMAEGLLDAGAEWKLAPAGENLFTEWARKRDED